jgi:pimeloyl-ACP methyl ester carboxylesterase
MSRRQMVIPGTGGVLYQTADGTQAASIFELLTRPDTVRMLRCEYPENPDELEPRDNPLTASGHMVLAYEPFTRALPGWEFFCYDWRLDIRFSGRRLASFLEAGESRGGRWHLVAHSQGGLVLLAAARLLGADRFARLVQSACFVGVPFFGAVSALVALLEGNLLDGLIPKEVVRTWPSVYQMLPRWGIFNGNPRRPDLLLDGTWLQAGLLPASGTPVELSSHIDRSLLERARVLHRATATGYFEPLRKLDYLRIIQGNNLETPLQLPRFPSQTGAIQVQGDSLVPDQFTWDQLPSWVRNEATIRRLPAARHMLLPSDPNVFELCL